LGLPPWPPPPARFSRNPLPGHSIGTSLRRSEPIRAPIPQPEEAAMRVSLVCGLAGITVLLGACSSDSTGPINGQPIHLTQAEVSALESQVTKLAPVFPELAFLADSVSVVLQAGAEADPVDITTDLGAGPFYAVGLQRAFSNGATSFTTFDFIAFNDPANPTDFIIVDGYAPGDGPTTPQSASGSFGDASSGIVFTGHLFHVSDNVVLAWRALAGTASMATGTTGGDCVAFQGTAGVTCTQAAMQASIEITQSEPQSATQGGESRSASLSSASVAGVLLSFEFP
ncbi:MAG: hypothetical protein ACREOJ_01120, partial [Gemmatimonadaceae bacterium]